MMEAKVRHGCPSEMVPFGSVWVIHHWIGMSLITHVYVFNHQQSFARLQLLEMSMESTRC